MRILDRYINVSILKIFLGTIFVFCFLYVLIDTTSKLDEFIDRKVPINIIIQYYLTFFPVILVQTSSLSCLIATLFTFSSLNNSNELIAMRSSGLSFWQIAKPALYFSLVVSALVFWMNENLVPEASAATRKIKDEHLILYVDRLKKDTQKIKNLTFYGLKNRLYFVDTFDPANSEINGVTIIGYDEQQDIREKIVSLKGKWTGINWKFFQCQITTFDKGDIKSPVKVKVYDEKLMDIQETPSDFMRQRLNVDAMNLRQLKEYILRFQNSGANRALNNLRVDFHQKIAYPFGNFVIVLVGLPFAMMLKNRKGTTFASLGVAVAIGFLFYVGNAVAIAFGKGGLLPPILAAWAAPMLFIGIALIMIENNF